MNPLKIGNVVRVASGGVEVVITAPDLNLLHEDRTYRVGHCNSLANMKFEGYSSRKRYAIKQP